jgi:hypothetical protein
MCLEGVRGIHINDQIAAQTERAEFGSITRLAEGLQLKTQPGSSGQGVAPSIAAIESCFTNKFHARN